MLVASTAREFRVGMVPVRSVEWDLDRVRGFAPTVVIDCAFLTRDLVGTMPLEDYLARNRQLTERMLQAAALESTRRVVTVSSGAAVFPVDALSQPIDVNPYGHLKREAEEALGSLATDRGVSAVVARAWSVSGSLVQKPRSYALSDMILQAAAGGISVTAT
jgi:nucleoside-diphosphate-sugar epimerase